MGHVATDFKDLLLGQPLELEFTEVSNPVTGQYFTSFDGVDLKFTVSDGETVLATLREDDDAVTGTDGALPDGATLTVLLVSNELSETLEAGCTYSFDGWLKDANDIWRPFNFGTVDEPSWIGFFTVINAITDIKD